MVIYNGQIAVCMGTLAAFLMMILFSFQLLPGFSRLAWAVARNFNRFPAAGDGFFAPSEERASSKVPTKNAFGRESDSELFGLLLGPSPFDLSSS